MKQIKNIGIGCKAVEVAKIIINKCQDKHIKLNTQKLEKLLVLAQIDYIRKSGKSLFTEDIKCNFSGVIIPEVDITFLSYGISFDENLYFQEYIILLEAENKSVDFVLEKYGHMDLFDLNALSDIQKVIRLSSKTPFGFQTVSWPILCGAFDLEKMVKCQFSHCIKK